jgi:class 3 adenylate cyclase/predicted ATPase
LTVLFADIVGSTALVRQHGEAWLDLLNRYHEICGGIVRRWGGHTAQFLGDGSLAYFGYPEAHDDDARRAVAAALEIVEAVPRVLGIDVRGGIDTGWTIVGGIGSADRRETLAVGEAVNESNRLQKLAAANGIVVSGSTCHLIRGFYECETMPSGGEDSTSAYRVVRATGLERRIDAARVAGLTPFVGREQEIAALTRLWSRAVAGTALTASVEGEAGIGKSRVIQVLKEHVERSGGQVVEWLCSSYAKGTPLRPVGESIARALHVSDDDPVAERLAKLEQRVAGLGSRPEDVVPLLAPLLSIRLPGQGGALGTTPQSMRRRLLETLLELLLALSNRSPLLLVVEDLHWADPSTLELIGLALERFRTGRLLVVLTARPEEFRWPWGSALEPERFLLPRLSTPEAERMIHELARRRALPSELLEEVAARSDGIPLFVEELTRAVLESEIVEERADRYELLRPLEAAHIPSTIQSSLSERLDRLAGSKRIAVVASALGRTFSYEMIRAVVDTSEAELVSHLARLVDADVLQVVGTPPDAEWTFRHALIREAAGASSLRKERRSLHARIARVLVERCSELAKNQPEVVARHFEQGGLPALAVEYYRQAGELALSRAANREAIEHLRRALGLLEELPKHERARPELALQLCLYPALTAIKGWASPEVEVACQRARELCEILGDRHNHIPALWGIWTVHFLRGNLNPAVVVAGQVLDMALATSDPLLHVLAHHAMGFTCFFRGEFLAAKRHAEQGIALFDAEREAIIVKSFQLSSSVALQVFRAAALWMLGDAREAEGALSEAERLVRSLGHSPSQAFFMSFAAYLGFYGGDHARVLAVSTDMLKLSEAEGFVLWIAVAKVYRGWARAGLGEIDAGLDETRQGLALFRKTESFLTLVQILVGLAQTLRLADRSEEALLVLDEGRQYADAHAEHLFVPELHRLQAEILLERPNPDTRAAEVALRRAIELARAQHATALEGPAVDALSRLLRAQARDTNAAQHASDANNPPKTPARPSAGAARD